MSLRSKDETELTGDYQPGPVKLPTELSQLINDAKQVGYSLIASKQASEFSDLEIEVVRLALGEFRQHLTGFLTPALNAEKNTGAPMPLPFQSLEKLRDVAGKLLDRLDPAGIIATDNMSASSKQWQAEQINSAKT